MFRIREKNDLCGWLGRCCDPRIGAVVVDPAILVVDDNEDNRLTLRMRLEICGYTNIVEAANGREALEKMRAGPIDIVLLDIMMPGLDGYGVLQEMKTDIDLRAISVVMVSAIEEMSSVIRCIELGATDYLTKPFNPVLLKARVDNCAEKVRYKAEETNYVENIKRERQRADELLATVLPKSIVRTLKLNGKLPPQRYEDVTVLFCDVVDFTAYSEKNPPDIVFAELEALVDRFEQLSEEYRLEKIKTVGDAYMATAGLLSSHDSPVLAAVACGLDMVTVGPSFGSGWAVRVGIDHGPVTAGIMGRSQFQYDVWGDTVNTAARIQNAGSPGSVTVSARAWLHLDHRARGRSLGMIDLKGKQKIELIECMELRR
jgi:class 3 adenylate cyclase/CheY-like chemotaxis protein